MCQELKLVISKERLQRTYHKLFGISEIENQIPLQWAFWAMLAYLFYNFSRWGFSNSWITKESAEQLHHTCWPYFLNCGDYYFLSSIFHGYSQTILYSFFLILFTGRSCRCSKKMDYCTLLYVDSFFMEVYLYFCSDL